MPGLNKELQWSEHFGILVFPSATCNNCVINGSGQIQFLPDEIFIAARGEMVEQGLVPPTDRDYLKNIQLSGNPHRAPAGTAGKWSEGGQASPDSKMMNTSITWVVSALMTSGDKRWL